MMLHSVWGVREFCSALCNANMAPQPTYILDIHTSQKYHNLIIF